MAIDGDLPKPLSRVHPRHGVPHVAVLSAGLISLAVAVAFMNNFAILTSMVNIGAITAFVAVNLSVLIVFFIRKHSRCGWAHLVIPVLGVASLLVVASQMSWIALVSGVTWLAAGIILYLSRPLRPKGTAAGAAPSAGFGL
jgi:amino acid transporter